jgi:hypothetical protein
VRMPVLRLSAGEAMVSVTHDNRNSTVNTAADGEVRHSISDLTLHS